MLIQGEIWKFKIFTLEIQVDNLTKQGTYAIHEKMCSNKS